MSGFLFNPNREIHTLVLGRHHQTLALLYMSTAIIQTIVIDSISHCCRDVRQWSCTNRGKT